MRTDTLSLVRLLASLAVVVCLAGPAQAQRDLRDIPPPDPELERQTFVLPEGFEVNLYAADPAIAKPIQISFDPAGRLWVASSEVYPHIKPGEAATDRILVLEDTDRDGVSDRTHVFAEGLLIPTGMAPGDGGAYVGASTELLHFADTDGDLRADVERVVLSGFGTEDTHHILHTFRWGPEQRLYFNQSIYIHSHIETPWGVRRLNAGGIWQFDPETLQLEVFARGFINAWGVDFARDGATFATDGAGGEGINYVVPGASYATAHGAERILPGLNPGSPKHCGLEVVESPHLPDDWQGSLLTNDFRGHRVCRFVLREEGSGYVSQEMQEVIKSDHVAFRPVDVKLGPDGAIYIADWYNPIIQHGEVDFRDPRRDHTHGRIWRVTWTGKPLVERPSLPDLSTGELLDLLRERDSFARNQAKRVLAERGKAILPELEEWYHRQSDAEAKLEGLWLAVALREPRIAWLKDLMACDNAGVRAAATRVLVDWHREVDEPLALLASRVTDRHPRVRLEAVRAAAAIPRAESIEVAMLALTAGEESPDQWLDYALWQTARDLKPLWEPALLAGKIDFGGNARQMAFVLKSAGSSATVGALTALLEERAVSPADQSEVLDVISRFGRPEDLQRLLEMAVAEDDSGQAGEYLKGLAEAHRLRKAKPVDPVPLLALRESESVELQASALRLLGEWNEPRGWEWLKSAAHDASTPLAVRVAAIAGVGSFRRDDAAGVLVELARGDEGEAVRQAAIEGLLSIDAGRASALAAEHLRRSENASGTAGLFEAFLSRPQGAEALAGALAKVEMIPGDVAVIGLRTIRASGRQYPELEKSLNTAGNLSEEPAAQSAEEMAALVERVLSSGDPHRGEEVYRREELACQRCHAIGEVGGLVGPNLRSLGTTAQLDYIIESLLDPNAKVKEGYHTVVIVDDEGRQYAGIKLRETATAVVLRNADGDELQIPLESVDLEVPGISLMPTGLTQKLTQAELIDLSAFLAALGRLPEFTVDQLEFARRWEVLEGTDAAAHQLRRTSYARAAADDPAFRWKLIDATVAGAVPLGDLDEVAVRNRVADGERGISVARTRLEVARAGEVQLRWNDVTGLQAWLDDVPLTLEREMTVSVAEGRNRLTVVVDRGGRRVPLSVQLVIPDGSTARASFATSLP